MLIDTRDRRQAHWMGGCAYPPEKWIPMLQARLAEMRRNEPLSPPAPAEPYVPLVRRQGPYSRTVMRWLELEDESAVAQTYVWFCATADALKRDGDAANVAFATRAGELLQKIDPRTYSIVDDLLDALEVVFEGEDWTAPCSARDAFAKRLDVVHRHGEPMLLLPVDRGDAPFVGLW